MPVKQLTFFLFLFSFLAISQARGIMPHPVHISVVNMDVISENKVQFSVKLFTDDFEEIINQINNTKVKFTKDTKIEAINDYVCSYIIKHLQLSKTKLSKKENFHLKSFKIKDEATWFYFDVQVEKKIKNELIIINSLMTDLYQDQTNLLILNKDGKDYAHRFNADNKSFNFVFE